MKAVPSMLSISSSISFPIQLFIPSEKKVTALLPIIHYPSEEINCLMRVWKATQLERINTDILLCLHNQAIIKMKRLTCFPNSVSFYIISQNDTRHLRHLYRVDHSKCNCGIMPSLLHTSTVNMGLFIKLGSICSSVHEIATLGRLIIYSTKGII